MQFVSIKTSTGIPTEYNTSFAICIHTHMLNENFCWLFKWRRAYGTTLSLQSPTGSRAPCARLLSHRGELFSAAAHRHLRSLCQACICNLTLLCRPRLWWMDVLKLLWGSVRSRSTGGQQDFHLESFKAAGNKVVPFGLMNKVGVAAPLSRGRVDEALAAVPLLRSSTCSGHSPATLLHTPPSDEALVNACRTRRSGEWIPDLPGVLAVISSLFRDLIRLWQARDEAS